MELIEQARGLPPEELESTRKPDFPEVDPQHVLSAEWEGEHFTGMNMYEGMHKKEARGYLRALKDRLSDVAAWDRRHLFLGDNLGLILALSKGRCRDPALVMLMRRAAALVLLTGAVAVTRWLPGELNAADEDSRRNERKGNDWKRPRTYDDPLPASQNRGCCSTSPGGASSRRESTPSARLRDPSRRRTFPVGLTSRSAEV